MPSFQHGFANHFVQSQYQNPPVAGDDLLVTRQDVALVINASDLLANDIDVDGDSLRIVEFTQPANGTVTRNGDDTFTYTPNNGSTGIDSFSYVVGDDESPVSLDSVRQYTFNHSLWSDAFGTNAVTLTVNDGSGNSGTCTANLTVRTQP